jgi:predicted RNA-binding Zn ribbon-like protein
MDLPEDLTLPLERGAPWWYWLGGRPALDFTNTLRERWWRRVETLVTVRDLGEWLVAAGLVEAVPPVSGEQLLRARELREAINTGIEAVLAGAVVPDAALAVIAREVPHGNVEVEAVRAEDGSVELREAAPADATEHALGLIARDAAQTFGSGEAGRLRVCASQTCSARFFDRSPAAGRRWCSSRGCGNVEKARRHRRRQRETNA